MFKKGQLVRSKTTSNIYLVKGPGKKVGFFLVETVSGYAKGLHGTVEAYQVLLIGNNYQPFSDPRAWATQKEKE